MKKKNFKVILFLIILLFICLILSFIKSKNPNYLNNVLIFNLYDNQENSDNKFTFDVMPNETQTKFIHLCGTFDTHGLERKIIYPGTKGEFEVLLKTSKDLKYQIIFESKNSKPQNLMFNIKGQNEKYRTLEDLNKNLRGVLYKNTIKTEVIQWAWQYETNNEDNIQDTIDGQRLNNYSFYINVLSYDI